jgi:hypothetical protein
MPDTNFNNQASELKNSNIVIAGVEDTGPQIKIKDHNKRTYSFFKNKKDGDQTAAFRNFQHFKVGDTVEISFKEVPYKEGTIKNVLLVKPASGSPESLPFPQAQTPPFASKERGQPGREYWEKREEKRQSSILMQVAFKSAVAMEAARVSAGQPEDRGRMYNEAQEFYDFMAEQIGEEIMGNDKNDIN